MKLRTSLGEVLAELERHGEPIVVEKGRRPCAVLISLATFEQRFVDQVAAERRRELAAKIRSERRRLGQRGPNSGDLLRELRGPLP